METESYSLIVSTLLYEAERALAREMMAWLNVHPEAREAVIWLVFRAYCRDHHLAPSHELCSHLAIPDEERSRIANAVAQHGAQSSA